MSFGPVEVDTILCMVSDIVKLAKIALADVDKIKVIELINCVNLTKQERILIEKCELDGERLSDMAEFLSLSIDSVSLIKRTALRKIGIYLTQKLR